MPDLRTLRVQAPSRLHFGLWCWGASYDRQFGGVGMMIDQPGVVLEFRNAAAFDVQGPATDRVQQSAEGFRAWCRMPQLPPCSIRVGELPPRHCGFGVGTQLSLAVVRGLAEWTGQPLAAADELAAVTSRARRSSVGTYGFLHGGLLVDGGRREEDPVGSLVCQIDVPENWRVVLITPKEGHGIAGDAERQAFANLPPVPIEVSQRLRQLALEQIVPACQQSDFLRFAAAVYEYGHLAGSCFASVQGGPYAGPLVTTTVDALRRMGIEGVGQSSWGPTVFAFVPDEATANRVLPQLSQQFDAGRFDITVARAQNFGARITCGAGLK